MNITFSDTLYRDKNIAINVRSGAEISLPKEGKKTSAVAALLAVKYSQNITNNIGFNVAIRTPGAINSIDIINGNVSFKQGLFTVTGGLLHYNDVYVEHYLNKSIYTPLFDKSIFWKSHGYGIGWHRQFTDALSIEGALSLNSRENGSVHTKLSFKKGNFLWEVLGGFQSYTLENQDNALIVGNTIIYDSKTFQCNIDIGATIYTGYASSANPTMTPGKKIVLYTDFIYSPSSRISFGAIGYIHFEKKRFIHKEQYVALNNKIFLTKNIGISSGYEYTRENKLKASIPYGKFFVESTKYKFHFDVGSRFYFFHRGSKFTKLVSELWFEY